MRNQFTICETNLLLYKGFHIFNITYKICRTSSRLGILFKFWSLVCAQQCPPPTSCSYIFCFQGILNLPLKTLMNSDMFMFVVQCQASSFLPQPDSVASLVFQKPFWEYSFGRHRSIKRWNNISDVWCKQVMLPCYSDIVHCWCSVKRNWQENANSI